MKKIVALLLSIMMLALAAAPALADEPYEVSIQFVGLFEENKNIANVEAVNPVELANVAEPEFQYGAEAFEAHQQETAKAMTADKATKNVPVKNGKSR